MTNKNRPHEKSIGDVKVYTKRLKITYWVFLVSFFAMGFLRSVVAKSLTGNAQYFFRFWLFFIFEHYFRSAVVAYSSYLTIKRAKALKGKVSRFRVISLVIFSLSLLLFLVIIPTIWLFMGFNSLFMAFPWSAAPLKILIDGEYFGSSFIDLFGSVGIRIAIFAYLAYQAYAYSGTILYGRRWYCSMICTLAGCHAESLGDVLPLIPHNKKRPKSKAVHPKIRIILGILRIFELGLSLFVFIMLGIYAFGGTTFLSIDTLMRLELKRILIFDTYPLVVGWGLVGGRFYCYYCPSGTIFGLVGRIVGQQIDTGLTKCTGCGLCNDACKMSIDVMSKAKAGIPVKDINCVGCGLCVDACPQENLQYSTSFLRRLGKTTK